MQPFFFYTPPKDTTPAMSQDKKKLYKPYLVKCMNLVKGTNHTIEYNFSDQELFTLTPHEIKRYLATLSYGIEDPSPTDLPTTGRASTLEFAKKAISYYMPNKNMVWNMQTNQGNPTRSKDLNDFIKDVRKKEVRKQGKPSQARRALTESEFRQVVKAVRSKHMYSLAAYYLFQFHMIARVDEYEFGVGGRKAAKTFSARERGRVKFKYCLRNHFWSLMKRMILRGYSHTSAIDKIYSVYGRNLSASKILYEIRKDSKNGGHPQLR